MPFTSPSIDSIVSPVAPTSWKQEKYYKASPRDISHRQIASELRPGRRWQNNTTPEKKAGAERSSSKVDESSRSKVPELNLITNFASSSSVHRTTTRAKGLNHYHQESLQVRRNMSRKAKNRDGMKGPIGTLRRADSRVSELSPSDATLLIGISIPSSNFMDSVKGSTASPAVPRNLEAPQVLTEKNRPLTPEIVINSAKLDEQWTDSVKQIGPKTRPKIASSVYSQAVQSTYQSPKASNIPTLSSMSQLISHPSTKLARRTSKRQRTINSKSRVQSWGTAIDEDYSPDSPIYHRRYSGESQLIMLKRSSVESIATRHRSKGWWNQILSPFLERSNTVMTRSSPTDGEKRRMANFSTNYQDSHFPDATDLEEDSPRSLVSTTWTDMTRDESRRRSIVISRNAHALALGGDAYNSQAQILFKSPEFENVAGFGAASEYYEACWHDQNSPTRFFRCQNHDCAIQKSRERRMAEEGTTYQGSGHHLQQIADASSSDREALDDIQPFRQNAANRFSAAFGEVQAPRNRPISETTIIEEDLDTTPEVQEAQAAPVVRAHRPMQAIRPVLEGGPTEEPPAETREQNLVTYTRLPDGTSLESQETISEYPDQLLDKAAAAPQPMNSAAETEELNSPEAVTPSLERAIAISEAIRLKQMPRDVPNEPYVPPPSIYNINQYYRNPQEELAREVDRMSILYPPPPKKPLSKAEEKRWMKATKEERPGSVDVQANISKNTGSQAQVPVIYDRRKRIDEKTKKRKKGRCLFLLIFLGLLAMIALVLGLAIGLTRQHSDMPVQSSWLNITGYPPIPTGISTIAQPDAAVEENGCVQPSTMWSCALPKEQQASIAPNTPDQPNFRVEIRFDNDSAPTNSMVSSRKVKRSKKRSGNAAAASFLLRSHLLQIRDIFADGLFAPNPSPPSNKDQVFLGNTTDNIAMPFDGEYTPFFMSFLPTTPIPSKLRKRQSSSSSNATDPFPNITQAIPPPELNPDGTAAAANLLPFPVSQPIRLYNRGLPTEHYGFYTYFDRAIFLRSSALANSSVADSGPVPDDGDGGAEENAATVRCTWAQTRFLVQIWTNQQSSSALLPSRNASAPATSSTSAPVPAQSANASTSSSANDFSRPGSFPYPVSITLDRHGGNTDSKMLYCYGMDGGEHIIAEEKKFVLEDRSFGGVLVNPAQGVFGNVNVTFAQGGLGGIDGGTGGCSCQWRNWEGRG